MFSTLRKPVFVSLILVFAGCSPPMADTTNMASVNPRIPASETATQATPTSPPPTDTQSPKDSATPAPAETQTPETTIPPFEVSDEISYLPDGDPAHMLSIYLPNKEQRKPLTLLVLGGEGFPVLVRYFVELGYPVIAFTSRNDSYLHEIQDGFCALAWAHTNASTYDFNENGIIPVGGSMWGGNAAIMGLVNDASPFLKDCPHLLPEKDRVRAVITLAGVFDYSEEEDFFYGFLNAVSDFMGGSPDQVPENWAAASAITWVEEDEPPFLLVHGEADTNVAAHQSEKFAGILDAAGTDVELVLIPGVNHSSSVTDRRVFDAMQVFLELLE
jgi:acetyl esterase/lipase